MRRQGALAESYTPSGQPPRRVDVGTVALATSVPPRESALVRLRELAGGGGTEADYAEVIEGAIASGDAVGLAYELGRLDATGEAGLPGDLVASALRRLSVLPPGESAGN